MDYLKQYLQQGIRHKLLFITPIEELKFIDIGYLLAMKLEDEIENRNISFVAEECIDSIIEEHVVHADFGDYVAIKNIGILFEPALKINVEAKIDSWSKSQALFINSGEGEIVGDVFYLTNKNQHRYIINLSNITYNQIIL